jgi:hypothetical protein
VRTCAKDNTGIQINQDLPLFDQPIFPRGADDEITHFKRFQFLPCLPSLIVDDLFCKKRKSLPFDIGFHLLIMGLREEKVGDLPFIPAADEVFLKKIPRT